MTNIGFDTVIGENMSIVGDVRSSESVRIDGNVEGVITVSSRLVTGTSSFIMGNINANTIEIGGTVKGNVEGQQVKLTSKAVVEGDITCSTLQTESGAIMAGKIIMKTAAVNPATARIDNP